MIWHRDGSRDDDGFGGLARFIQAEVQSREEANFSPPLVPEAAPPKNPTAAERAGIMPLMCWHRKRRLRDLPNLLHFHKVLSPLAPDPIYQLIHHVHRFMIKLTPANEL